MSDHCSTLILMCPRSSTVWGCWRFSLQDFIQVFVKFNLQGRHRYSLLVCLMLRTSVRLRGWKGGIFPISLNWDIFYFLESCWNSDSFFNLNRRFRFIASWIMVMLKYSGSGFKCLHGFSPSLYVQSSDLCQPLIWTQSCSTAIDLRAFQSRGHDGIILFSWTFCVSLFFKEAHNFVLDGKLCRRQLWNMSLWAVRSGILFVSSVTWTN